MVIVPFPKPYRYKQLLLCLGATALLFSSLFFPWTRQLWETIDVAFFKFINHSLRDRPLWQIFWALANHKLADWVEDLFILCFFITYVRQAPRAFRLKRTCQLLFFVLYIGAIIYFVNGMFFREHWTLPRLSPTLVVEDSVRLSQEIPWMSIKDGSSKSFPGDHGTTALLFAASFTCLAGWRLGAIACLYAAFLCMPRLITGAHWLSDILVGSGSITLLFMACAIYTPLLDRISEKFARGIRWIGRRCKAVISPGFSP